MTVPSRSKRATRCVLGSVARKTDNTSSAVEIDFARSAGEAWQKALGSGSRESRSTLRWKVRWKSSMRSARCVARARSSAVADCRMMVLAVRNSMIAVRASGRIDAARRSASILRRIGQSRRRTKRIIGSPSGTLPLPAARPDRW